jgi:hypothetical protein
MSHTILTTTAGVAAAINTHFTYHINFQKLGAELRGIDHESLRALYLKWFLR